MCARLASHRMPRGACRASTPWCAPLRASQVQLGEGMAELPSHGALARKYCGGGHGGYALYLFGSEGARAEFLHSVPGTHALEPWAGHPR